MLICGKRLNLIPKKYASFNDFFIRTLKPDARPIVQTPTDIASPIDGFISQIGTVQAGTMLQAKKFNFTVTDLLGGDETRAAPFQNGQFATLYLAPNVYHRVHMPITGQLKEMIYIPGKLFAVNPPATRVVSKLFARNERVVCLFETDIGPMAVVLVGAIIVAGIHMNWHGDVAPHTHRKMSHWHYANESKRVERGDEIGYFKLGSTVVVLFPDNKMEWHRNLQVGSELRLGQSMGQMTVT